MIRRNIVHIAIMTVQSTALWAGLGDYTPEQLNQARTFLTGREYALIALDEYMSNISKGSKKSARITFSNSILEIDISKRIITTYFDTNIEKCKVEKSFVILSYEEFDKFMGDSFYQRISQQIKPKPEEGDLLFFE